jgi:hypothetical protein
MRNEWFNGQMDAWKDGWVNGRMDGTVTPNVVIEWLAFLFRIRKVCGSILAPQTGYPG